MKKLLAVLLAVVMLFSVATICSSAAETPKVTIVTNQGSPVDAGVPTYLTVKFTNFGEIQGADVIITADKNIKLEDIVVTGFPSASKDNNYTQETDGEVTTIHFVDLTKGANGKITFKATVPEPADDTVVLENPVIKVEGKYAKDGTTLFDVEAPLDGTFELTKKIAASEPQEIAAGAEVNVEFDPAKKFVPQGAVYIDNGDDTYTFATKQADGSFLATDAGDYVYKAYDIPSNKITTFGASNDPDDPSRLRFGSYSALNDKAEEHGTLVFEGNWLALKNLYIQNGYSVKDFVEAIYSDVTEKLAANENANHVSYKVGEDRINVYRFKQTKYMWKDEANGVLEYAIRLSNVKENTKYTGIAFSIAKDTGAVTIAENVKTVN